MKQMAKTGFLRAVRDNLRALRSDESGYAYMFTGLALTTILGFAGAALDLANLYSERRNTQNMADSAAIAGTIVDIDAESFRAVQAAAQEEAVRNGFEDDGINTLNVTDSAGAAAGGVTPMVEVVIQRHIPVYLISTFVGTKVPVSARAVAGMRALGPKCIVALSDTAEKAVDFSGNVSVDAGCGVISNSASASAISISGNASLTADPVQAFGDIEISGHGVVNSSIPPRPYSPKAADPYGEQSFPPAIGACDYGSITVTAGGTLEIGPAVASGSVRVCGDIDVNAQGTLNLDSGTYYVDDGNLKVNGQGTLSGDGVTVVMTGTTQAGQIEINGGAIIDLSAPSSGSYEGIVLYQDPAVLPSGDNRINGGATMDLDGVLYFPGDSIEFSGGADVPGCTMIVANTVSFSGNSFLNNDPAECEAIGLGEGVGGVSQQTVVLVE